VNQLNADILTHSSIHQKPVLSSEIFTIPLEDNRYLIYAPLRKAAFIANVKAVNLLASIQAGKYKTSSQQNNESNDFLDFFRSLELLDASPESQPEQIYSGEPVPTSITLFLTTDCNLRCTYCYASAGDTPKKSMALAIACRGINYVVNNAVQENVTSVQIAYHGGGEPTVNWQVLAESLEYAKTLAVEHNITIEPNLATNGVMSDRRIDWIIDNISSVSLSFDGLPELHDQSRITVKGEGSSQHVIHTMQRFDDAGFPYGVRMTVTEEQISKIPESVEYICSHYAPLSIQVEPVYQLGRWSDMPSAETDLFIENYRQAKIIAREFDMDISFSAARVGLLTNHFCGVSQDSFALSADGNVSACYEVFSEDDEAAEVFFYGKPAETSQGYEYNLKILDNLRNQRVEKRDFCKSCFAKWSCGGDCYNKAISTSFSGEFEGSQRCHIIRELSKDQILDNIAESGGLFWHELPNEYQRRE